MSSDPKGTLSELELDVIWTVYEGHSLVIERPLGDQPEIRAHVILSVAFDEADEAVAEVADIPLETATALIERGYLERSFDGPVLDEHRWFDDDLGVEVEAEEYLLSELAHGVIDNTSEPDDDEAVFGLDELDDVAPPKED